MRVFWLPDPRFRFQNGEAGQGPFLKRVRDRWPICGGGTAFAAEITNPVSGRS